MCCLLYVSILPIASTISFFLLFSFHPSLIDASLIPLLQFAGSRCRAPAEGFEERQPSGPSALPSLVQLLHNLCSWGIQVSCYALRATCIIVGVCVFLSSFPILLYSPSQCHTLIYTIFVSYRACSVLRGCVEDRKGRRSTPGLGKGTAREATSSSL